MARPKIARRLPVADRAAADKLRSNMDAAEYKHIVLGLIFLKYISDAFNDLNNKLKAGKGEFEGADPEDADEYLAHNIFFVPEKARWQYLQDRAKKPEIGKLLDEAMDAIEKINASLKGVLPKIYADPELNKQRLGELIDLIGTFGFNQDGHKAKDLLGRVYEYFLGQFADAEGKKGGQFWTPVSIVKLLVEMLEPYNGRVYDGCSGSGGMFVQSEKFVEEHQGNIKDLSIYGQESNPTTLRLAKMNLAIRGIDARIELGDTFLNDRHKELKADFILANPPFNISDWSGDKLRDDDIKLIAQTYHNWRGKDGQYEDRAGFCKAAIIEEAKNNNYALMPGRYVGTEEEIDDGVPFEEKMNALTAKLAGQFAKGSELEKTIRENLKGIGYEF